METSITESLADIVDETTVALADTMDRLMEVPVCRMNHTMDCGPGTIERLMEVPVCRMNHTMHCGLGGTTDHLPGAMADRMVHLMEGLVDTTTIAGTTIPIRPRTTHMERVLALIDLALPGAMVCGKYKPHMADALLGDRSAHARLSMII